MCYHTLRVLATVRLLAMARREGVGPTIQNINAFFKIVVIEKKKEREFVFEFELQKDDGMSCSQTSLNEQSQIQINTVPINIEHTPLCHKSRQTMQAIRHLTR
jgi:hypothetical protein